MKLQEYQFNKDTRKDISLVDFINDVNKIVNLGRYQMRVVSTVPTHTGDEGEFLIYVSSTVRRFYWYDITNSTWQFIEWNNSGLSQATIVGTVSLTAQTGDINATTIYTPTALGLYRISVYALCTTGATAGLLDVTIGWTDDKQAQSSVVVNDLNLNTAGNAATYTLLIRSTATAITYTTAIAGKDGTPQYALFIAAERLT
jgi:hypothetical protein